MAFLAAACLSSPNGHAAGKCQIAKIGVLPITMNSLRPVVPPKSTAGTPNSFFGQRRLLQHDRPRATADEYSSSDPGPWGMVVTGVGGTADVNTTVKEFSIVGVTIKNVNSWWVVAKWDQRVCLARISWKDLMLNTTWRMVTIRLFHTDDCEHARLAYWLQPDQPSPAHAH
jgi:hypothetical protein